MLIKLNYIRREKSTSSSRSLHRKLGFWLVMILSSNKKSQMFKIWNIFGPPDNWTANFFVHFLLQIGLKIWIPSLLRKILRKILSQNWKIYQKLSFWVGQKSALFSTVSEEISAVQLWNSTVWYKNSAETALFQHWFLALKFFVIDRCSELNQLCLEIFR